jgi:hypothetical protein
MVQHAKQAALVAAQYPLRTCNDDPVSVLPSYMFAYKLAVCQTGHSYCRTVPPAHVQ